ncbi:hypothetical protein [Arthrobacter methylotrophus]|uniref:hypothetical protein n=1 Tax=Arthrobacter methylotrophus TaxID=121291 RepID=UPI0031E59BAB
MAAQAAFDAAYSGDNSLGAARAKSYSFTATLDLGMRCGMARSSTSTRKSRRGWRSRNCMAWAAYPTASCQDLRRHPRCTALALSCAKPGAWARY